MEGIIFGDGGTLKNYPGNVEITRPAVYLYHRQGFCPFLVSRGGGFFGLRGGNGGTLKKCAGKKSKAPEWLYNYMQVNCIPKRLMLGNEKAVLDLTFLKIMITPQQISPAEDNPTIA